MTRTDETFIPDVPIGLRIDATSRRRCFVSIHAVALRATRATRRGRRSIIRFTTRRPAPRPNGRADAQTRLTHGGVNRRKSPKREVADILIDWPQRKHDTVSNRSPAL